MLNLRKLSKVNFQRLDQIQPKIQFFFITVFLAVFVSSCSSSRSHENRVIHADSIIYTSQLTPLPIKTTYFELHAAYHFPEPDGLLTVYIEGDGRSWVSRFQLSSNPTPINPVALNLAVIHTEKYPNTNTAWLARPCQYQPVRGDVNCEPKYWSSHRFSEQVIGSTNIAIDQLMQNSSAKKVRLIGFSGGAAVAILAAARRDDVDSIVSVAGNLNHEEVNLYHKVNLLRGSLNSIDVVDKIKHIPQMHFIGSDDEVIPTKISTDFIRAQKVTCAKQVIVPGVGHIDGWITHWPILSSSLGTRLSCE